MSFFDKEMERFIKFLIGYTCSEHTTTDELNEKMQEITEGFVSTLPIDRYYTAHALKRYLYILSEELTDELKGPITLRFYDKRYVDLLVKYLQHNEK